MITLKLHHFLLNNDYFLPSMQKTTRRNKIILSFFHFITESTGGGTKMAAGLLTPYFCVLATLTPSEKCSKYSTPCQFYFAFERSPFSTARENFQHSKFKKLNWTVNAVFLFCCSIIVVKVRKQLVKRKGFFNCIVSRTQKQKLEVSK